MNESFTSIDEKIYSDISKNNTLFSVTIELLTKCNWHCTHCYIPTHISEGMSKETISYIFQQLRDLGTFEIILTGGEIFIRSDILDIIKIARQMFFKVTLLTNISLLNEDIIHSLSKLNLHKISCTIFSLNKELHDSITGIPGSLDNVLANIEIIKRYNIPFEIKSVLMNNNFNSYMELKEFCTKNNFHHILTPIVSSKINGDKSPHKLRVLEEDLEQFFLYYDIPSSHKSKSDYICNTIRYSLFIAHDGNVYPCNTFNIPVGNIYSESIGSIWVNSHQLANIRNMRWSDSIDCSNCDCFNYCKKCPGLSQLEDGNILSKSSLACTHANIRYKLYNRKEIPYENL